MRALAHELLYPLGIGFGLASELGALWLILRWRSRRKQQKQETSVDYVRQDRERPPARRPSPTSFMPDEDQASSVALLLSEVDTLTPQNAAEPVFNIAANPAPARASPAMAYEARAHQAPPHQSPAFTPPPALATAHAPRPAAFSTDPLPPQFPFDPAPLDPPPADPPPMRGVFKPSSLFSRIEPVQPVEAVPIARLDPLTIEFSALRLTVTPSRVEMRYRILVRNASPTALGPITLEACMGTTGGDLPQTAQEYALAALMPGEEGTITGDWRIALSMLPTLRLGAMRLFVGAAHVVATIDPDGHYRHAPCDRTFLIGLPEEGGRLAPIPLDGAAHIYDSLIVQSIAPDQA